MSKLNRILWSGLVLGIAACGDNVTVTQPPAPPTPGIASVSVAPNGASIQVGGTVQMTAAVSLETGATGTPTIAWSSSDATKATVNGSGLVTGVAAGSVGISATATLGTSTKSGAATVTVVNAPTCSISGVTVSPDAAALVIGQTLAVAANVSGTNCTTAQLGVTYSTSNAAVATVSAAGLVTAAGAGSATITATSSTDASKKAAMSVSVTAPQPATVSIQSITQGALPVPVDLTNVGGQVEVTLNVDPGAAPSVTKAQVLIGGIVVAEQTYASASANASSSSKPQLAVSTLVLSTNTRQVTKLSNGLYVPVVFNGPSAFSARIFVANSSTPAASNAVPVVMQNADAIVKGPTAVAPATPSPSYTDANPTTWYTGNVNFTGGNYISFFPVTPADFQWNSPSCGLSNNAVSGTPQTGLTFNGQVNCGGVEGGVGLDGFFQVTAGTAPAADVIYIPVSSNCTAEVSAIVSSVRVTSAAKTKTRAPRALVSGPTGCYEQTGTAYTINGDPGRYNLLANGSFSDPGTVYIDNVGPTITPNEIGFMAGCSATIPTPGCWINGSYNLAGDFPAVDGGSGVASDNTFLANWDANPVNWVCTSTSLTPANAAEDPSPIKYFACSVAADNLGNTSSAFGFNQFGVDKTSPTITYATATGTLYSPSWTLSETVPAQVLNWKVNDNNAGLDSATALSVAANWTLNGSCANTIDTRLATQATPGADRYMLTPIPSPDNGCAKPGYYSYQASVKDRAGNTASDSTWHYGLEPGVPTISAIAPQPLYGGGQANSVLMFASHTGASLSAAKLGVWYTSAGTQTVRIMFDEGQIFNAPWQTPLFLATPAAGTTLSLNATQSLAGIVIDSTQAPVSAFDSVTAVVRDVFDASGLTGTLVHADTADLALAAPFRDATKISTDAAVWANPKIGAAVFSGSGSCTFTYATPTNGPTIPTAVAVVNEAAPFRYDALFLLNSQPSLISDNGTTRLYQYTVTSATCASLGTPRLIAIKNDVNGLPVGYLIP